MAVSDNRILKKLLDRLFASLINGPSLNCRPHSSRQRIDLTQLAKLRDESAEEILRVLLGPDRQVKVSAKVPATKGKAITLTAAVDEADEEEEELSPEEKAARQAFREQQSVLGKLRSIAEDSRTYENDTGVHVLQIGFPLLSLPPGSTGRFGMTRRILAPLAFISLSMTIKGGPTPTVVLECRNEGADLIVPNIALLAWLEGQTGQTVGDLFNDETGDQPWNEITAIAKRVSEIVQIALPPAFESGGDMPADFKLSSAPRSDDDGEEPKPTVIPAAVIGLYPMSNQGLLRDMQALVAGEAATGPIESFINIGVSLEPTPQPAGDDQLVTIEKRKRSFAQERLVTVADPCQARAVHLARASRGLVVHGPPGTGKSQTIANVVGDHLARGERVLFVCEKRTALDVVINRLEGMGLGALCAIVHDPQRDQRELYKSIREQLDSLPDLKTDASADGSLNRTDAELQKIHDELTEYHRSLMVRPDKDTASFHELMGNWLELPTFNVELDPSFVAGLRLSTVDQHATELGDLFERAARVGYVSNPWAASAAMSLDSFLMTPVDELRREVARLEAVAAEIDRTADPQRPIRLTEDLTTTADAWTRCAERIAKLCATIPAEQRGPLLAVPREAIRASLPALDAVIEDANALTNAPASLRTAIGAIENRPSAKTITAEIGWLERFGSVVDAFGSALRGRGAEQLDGLFQQLTQYLKQAVESGFMSGPQRAADGLPIDRFVGELSTDAACDTTDLLRAARAVDSTASKSIPPFRGDASPTQIGAARSKLADDLHAAFGRADLSVRRRIAGTDPGKLNALLSRLQAAEPIAAAIEAQPLDASILLIVQLSMPTPAVLEADKQALSEYEASGKGILSFLSPGKKSAATKVLQKYGLGLNAADIQRCRVFLEGVKQRLALRLTIAELAGESAGKTDDSGLVDLHRSMMSLVVSIRGFTADPLLIDVGQRSREWLAADVEDSNWTDALRASAGRADAIDRLRAVLTNQGVSSDGVRWLISRALAGRSCLLSARLLSLSAEPQSAATDSGVVRAITLFGVARSALRTSEATRRLDVGERFNWNDVEAVLQSWQAQHAVAGLIASIEHDPSLSKSADYIINSIGSDVGAQELTLAFRNGIERVAQLHAFERAVRSNLLLPECQFNLVTSARAEHATSPDLAALANRLDSLEYVLRVRAGLNTLPADLQAAAGQLVKQNVSGEVGVGVLRKVTTSAEIMQRLRTDRQLTAIDAQHLQTHFRRYLELDNTKKLLARQSILHRWGSKQKERLLASTGTRLNSAGADLRRRLTIRGERAMRLRQVISVGQNFEDGDPLYDLRPVWMASPETVAQIFPRTALFDVVIFDEASQCRLEEALPVLLRSKRVVIAGDPKQLPPTRFFESAVAASDEIEAETEQQLFESQQGEIEDLLAAALNIEIDECYLDVHYRSRNSDLIEFSNDKFYGQRLQAIPGHPKNRTRFAPLTLYKTGGIYEKRTNVIEADRVVQIVRDLLKRADPPTIGVACFNIAQRNLIVEKLDEAAMADAAFGKALAAARERRSSSSFEGLFVKNLENVQGDERDHMIISTTYGPDPKGRFYRRFGPVGSAGGGRRLNVLVTRARDEVHLVTSIPETVYRNLPPIPSGETPGGAWLLFAYLVYAEQLADLYEREYEAASQEKVAASPTVNERPTRFPSSFSLQLAKRLQASDSISSDVHWGNDGFCTDVALHHPKRIDDVTIGVLCDMNRFEQAADPVEWEVFRTAILEGQGWKLNRVWTPHFFRDPTGNVQSIKRGVDEFLAGDIDPDALPTTVTT
jgi:AAA domain/REase_MTES_1575/Protein of unknown function (DUF4011)